MALYPLALSLSSRPTNQATHLPEFSEDTDEGGHLGEVRQIYCPLHSTGPSRPGSDIVGTRVTDRRRCNRTVSLPYLNQATHLPEFSEDTD